MRIAPPQAMEFTIRGRIFNRKTHELMPDAKVRYSAALGPQNTISSPNGFFTLTIPKRSSFAILPQKKPLSPAKRKRFFCFGATTTISRIIIRLISGSTPWKWMIKLNFSPFTFSNQKPLSWRVLIRNWNALPGILYDNPKLEIRIEGHTDNLGKVEDLFPPFRSTG